MRFHGSLLVGIFGTFAACTPIQHFEFSGVVDSTSFRDGTGLGALGVGIGDPVTGSFTYDTSVADLNADPKLGRFPQHLENALVADLDGHEIAFSDYEVDVTDDYILPGGAGPFDLFELQGIAVGLVDGVELDLHNTAFDMTGAPPTTLVADAIPSPAVVQAWPGDLDLTLQEANPPANRISIKQLHVQYVP